MEKQLLLVQKIIDFLRQSDASKHEALTAVNIAGIALISMDDWPAAAPEAHPGGIRPAA